MIVQPARLKCDHPLLLDGNEVWVMMRRTCFFIFLISFGTSVASAEAPAPKCDAVEEMMLYVIPGLPKKHPISLTTLRQNTEAKFLLFISHFDKKANNSDGLYMPWRLLSRKSIEDVGTYCLIGAGDRLEALESISNAKTSARYGMPGSGWPRCTDHSASVLDGLNMRLWANKELGESTVHFLHNEIGPKNYYYMKAHDDNWILLDSQKNDINQMCYFARGTDSLLRTIQLK